MMAVTGLSVSIPNAHASPTINFVGSISQSSSGTFFSTSTTVNYTSLGSHFIFVQATIAGTCTISSVADSGGSTYSKLARYGVGNNNQNGTGLAVEAWSTTGQGSIASTSVTVSYYQNQQGPGFPCDSRPGISIAEYSGAHDVLGVVSVNQNTLGNSEPTLSYTLTAANNWLISGFNVADGDAVLTADAGILRTTNSAPVGKGAIEDNTASSATSVTTSLHVTGGTSSSSWVVVGVELRTGVTVTTVSCSPSTIHKGKTSTCSATVTGSVPTGTISWSVNGGSVSPTTCTLSSGSCSTTYTAPSHQTGTFTVTASYSGDSRNYSSSGSTNVVVS